ncbi:hypothetical protein ACQP2P_11425 [Dactylosporangium sp. CA-139114]|uniref:hypothetical protein n=1 Tax=Dactylosporangium sp. CA-139114 TaxID=3239931 RepID=UPI003D97E3AF
MRYVGVSVDRYRDDDCPDLPSARRDVRNLRTQFALRGCLSQKIVNEGRSAVLQKLVTPVDGHRSMVLYWAGHAWRDQRDELHLLLPNAAFCGGEVVRPSDVVSAVFRSGIRQLLFVLDTCYAGNGILEGLRAAFIDADNTQYDAGEDRWVGVLAAAQSYERASDVLGSTFVDLLRQGPSNPADRVHWNAYNAAVRGVDVAQALHGSWPRGLTQQPWFGSFGWSQPMLPNPFYDPAATARRADGLFDEQTERPRPSRSLYQQLAALEEPRRSTATHLLQVLAAGYGRGVPARDVWATVASKIANPQGEPTDSVYSEEDMAWTLRAFGRHIVVDGEASQVVYRLANEDPEAKRRLLADHDVVQRIDSAMLRLLAVQRQRSRDDQDQVNPYLVMNANRHRSRAVITGASNRPSDLWMDDAGADSRVMRQRQEAPDAVYSSIDERHADVHSDRFQAALMLILRAADSMRSPAAALADARGMLAAELDGTRSGLARLALERLRSVEQDSAGLEAELRLIVQDLQAYLQRRYAAEVPPASRI